MSNMWDNSILDGSLYLTTNITIQCLVYVLLEQLQYILLYWCSHPFILGVGNDLKFCRSPLKLFLKDEILAEFNTFER